MTLALEILQLVAGILMIAAGLSLLWITVWRIRAERDR